MLHQSIMLNVELPNNVKFIDKLPVNVKHAVRRPPACHERRGRGRGQVGGAARDSPAPAPRQEQAKEAKAPRLFRFRWTGKAWPLLIFLYQKFKKESHFSR